MKDKSLLRRKRLEIRLTDSEFQLLQQRQQQTRATSLSDFLRSAALREIFCTENVRQITYKSKDEKERSKEKEENSTPPGNAPARPREDFDFYFSQITDDESLRGLVEEFLRGEIQKGVDLARKTDLREHFWRWLPKYQAKREIAAKAKNSPPKLGGVPEGGGSMSPAQLQNQLLAKRRREEKAAELQRQLDAQSQAADSPEAKDAAARVFARLTKPWKKDS